MPRTKILFLLICVCSAILFSFTKPTKSPLVYELTDTDILGIKDFSSHSLSIFGVTTGMTMEEVEMAISNYDNVVLMDDKYNKGRIYLYDFNKNCLAYFIWDKGDKKLSRIVLYDDISKYLSNGSAALFSGPQAPLARRVLGNPDMSKVTLTVESIHLQQVSYFYLAKQMEMIRQDYALQEEYMLVLHNK